MASATVGSSTLLGKRRTRSELVLRLASSPEPTESEATSSDVKVGRHVLINGRLTSDTKRRYQCTFEACQKAYTKPSRLEEHERTHIGLRPFACTTCHKSYFRESHLHAHSRTHLPESERPFVCDRPNCPKRFWTNQHLKVHYSWHDGAKVFTCTYTECSQSFMKHNQLRAHVCAEHSPPGTKPYQCPHDHCSRSFDTNQHMKTHLKTHEDKRYTCVHQQCIPVTGASPVYFTTWTALQHHLRTIHPPTCPHSSCHGKTFTTHKGLRAHEKLHQERDVEATLDPDSDEEHPRKKRRGGEVGRDWVCPVEGCCKDFKSKKASGTHHKITHLGRRDFVCSHNECGRTFGYKHLLQRHLAKAHPTEVSLQEHQDAPEAKDEEYEEDAGDELDFDLDTITGNRYKQRAKEKLATSANTLRCPFPNLTESGLVYILEGGSEDGHICDYVFIRAYDLRRHLRATHGVFAEKGEVVRWIKEAYAAKPKT